jgi:L-seryl-tRNA(Ser) seleniumtransferase
LRGMLETEKRELLRGLPAVDAVLREPRAEGLVSRHGTKATTAAVREALGRARREILAGGDPKVSGETMLAVAAKLLEGRGLRRVVNATGVVLHTNLGRSVLSERAVEAAVEAATSYSNLEYDVSAG